MGVNTQQYIRKPLYVEAVRVSVTNFDECVKWCMGEVDEEEGRNGEMRKFIRVRVHNPKNSRQTKAFVGDWLLYTERGFKVYTNKAFRAAFDQVDEPKLERKEYPYEEGDTVILGPEIFMAEVEGRELINWKGVNFVPQTVPELDVHTTPQDEPHEYVEATPQAIADVVNEQQPTNGKTEVVPDVAAALESKVEEVGAAQAAAEATPPPEEAKPVPEQAPEVAAAGKMVISEEEQRDLGPDQVRELLRSGDAVLAQDLA